MTGNYYLTPRHVEGKTRIVYQELASSLNYSIYQFTIFTELISCLKIWTLKIVSKFLSILVSHYEKIFWVKHNFCTWIICSSFEKNNAIYLNIIHKKFCFHSKILYIISCINMFTAIKKKSQWWRYMYLWLDWGIFTTGILFSRDDILCSIYIRYFFIETQTHPKTLGLF